MVENNPHYRLRAVERSAGKLTGWGQNLNATSLDQFNAIEAVGNVVVLAGTLGAQRGVFGLDAADSNRRLWFTPSDGHPSVLAVSGTTVYLGGSFGAVGGQTRDTLAALNGATGQVLPFTATFGPHLPANGSNPPVNPSISRLIVSGGTLYVSGFLNKANDQARPGAAAFNLASAALTPWSPVGVENPALRAVQGNTVYFTDADKLGAL